MIKEIIMIEEMIKSVTAICKKTVDNNMFTLGFFSGHSKKGILDVKKLHETLKKDDTVAEAEAEATISVAAVDDLNKGKLTAIKEFIRSNITEEKSPVRDEIYAAIHNAYQLTESGLDPLAPEYDDINKDAIILGH